MNFPIIDCSAGRTQSMRISMLSAPRLIWAVNRIPMMTNTERKTIFFMHDRRKNSAFSPFSQSAIRNPQSALFQYLSGLARPQEQIEVVHVDADLHGELLQLFFNRKIARAGRRPDAFADHPHLSEAVQNMFIQDGIAGKPDIPEKVARLFIAQTLNLLVLREKIAPCVTAIKGLDQFFQPESAGALEIVPRMDDIGGPYPPE